MVGKALLDRARSLSNRSEEQIARGCGYVGPSGRVLKKSFYRALVEAKGYATPARVQTRGHARSGVKGRQADFRTRVHGNGNLMIGHAYTRRLGLLPGDELRIELHAETGSIWLHPLKEGPSETEGGSDLRDPCPTPAIQARASQSE
ncbi:MAG: AbrB family transcriptional regulator [Cyanobacteriota bacterium]|nr:AbrB family transcriptional regulator [Cyanobacteriota bacterium]